MNPVDPQNEDGNDSAKESDYANYSGEYTLPAGALNKTQNLGTIVFYGSYKGMSESKTGGSIKVKPIPIPEPENDDPTGNGDTRPIDPGTGDTVLASGKIVTVINKYAQTFSDTNDTYSRSINAYLPEGTTDVIKKPVTVYDDNGNKHFFYLLGCGRRVYTNYVAVYKNDGKLTENRLEADPVTVNTKATVITLDANWHIPYNLRLYPQKYIHESTDDYDISSFTATYVDITFYYTTSVNGTPDVGSSPLFKSAEWIKGSGNTYILRLHLRNQGAFYGYSVGWNKTKLMFSFKNPTGMGSSSKPLSGKKIVIDPGHGGNQPGFSRGHVEEKDLTLEYSLILRDKLVKKGATVIMTRTGDTNPDNNRNPPSLYARTDFARNNYTDLFISIHMDSYSKGSVRGYSIFYSNEYSFPVASGLHSFVDKAYKESGGISGRASPVSWYPYNVIRLHDCPAILLECGFMSNDPDLEILISQTYKNKLAQYLTDGIIAYFKSIATTAASTTTQSTPQTTTTVAAAIVPAELVAFARGRKKRRPVR